ncbi:MAG: FG-GAP-like repeat-containing protein [Gemmataceae bacterium]
MSESSSFLGRHRLLLPLLGAIVVMGGSLLLAWRFWPRLPQPGSQTYEAYVEAFEVGTAALDSGLVREAKDHLTRAIELVPQEPAAWANRGLLALRNNQLDEAGVDFEQAYNRMPGQADLEELLGLLAEDRGKVNEAIDRFTRALQASPEDVRRLYSLSRLNEKLGPSGDTERERLLNQILELRPTSLPVLVERLQLAVRRGNRTAMSEVIARLEKLASGWQDKTRQMLETLKKEAGGNYDERDLVVRVGMLGNLLRGELGYARSAGEINPEQQGRGTALQQFLRLAPMQTEPSPPDLELRFVDEKLEGGQAIAIPPEALAITSLDGTTSTLLAAVKGEVVSLDGRKKPATVLKQGGFVVAAQGLLPVDWNNDHRTDLLLAGPQGLRWFEQDRTGQFKEVTASTKVPEALLRQGYVAAWAIDVDLDGDLDLMLASVEGPPVVLRNNADGTFTPIQPFPGTSLLRGFCWADLDADGVPDAALLDKDGKLQVYMNERGGLFRARPISEDRFLAVGVADISRESQFDLVALRNDGSLVSISDKERGKSWQVRVLGNVEQELPVGPGEGCLHAADLDRNGAIDLLWRTPRGGVAWLADGRGSFSRLPEKLPPGRLPPDILGEGQRLELVGNPAGGKLSRWMVEGSKGYHWHRVRPRGNPNGSGDQRINSYALGSEVELRSGSLHARQMVTGPVVEFGLGSRAKVSLMRFVWTNGAAQYEFDRPADEFIRVEQRLKGSCPFLFGWDGTRMAFLNDFCWSTPLGLYINAQKRGGGFQETTEWIRIRSDQLRPRDGYYDLRVNANLWETHYLDHLTLQEVDHPEGTEVYCDERFFLTPTRPTLYLTGPACPVARAWDHTGQEVTDLVRTRDERYLDRAGRGPYQGVTRDHWVEIQPGPAPEGKGPVYLIAQGWLHPTDSSINVALEQSTLPRPQPLTLEVPDGKGGWRVALPALGFPAGKNKTVVLRLDDLDGGKIPERVRLRTSMEVYWDALLIARGQDAAQVRRKTLAPTVADLRFRGILGMSRANASSPEIPHYDQIEHIRQPWRDLIGYYTRFGDVRELLNQVDDRYVILNAGDEIVLRYPASDAPPKGWVRDFVWVSDGWTKDGDFNTRFGKTVIPLPYHGMGEYEKPPRRLEDDPVYKRHAADWYTYHTRYVLPTEFERGLRPPPRRQP